MNNKNETTTSKKKKEPKKANCDRYEGINNNKMRSCRADSRNERSATQSVCSVLTLHI